ncbi:unnamed protein product [Wickerhamomyces anomalus]
MLSLRSKALQASRRFNSTSSVFKYYKTPEIPQIDVNAANGINGLFSKQGLQNAWYKRAEIYCDALDKEIAREGLAAHDPEVLVNQYAKSSSKLQLFNNASLLYNTEFAMSCLGGVRNEDSLPAKPDSKSLLSNPDISHEIPNQPIDETFQDWIKDSFGSVLEFKTLLLNSANAINGDGFTWLVARTPNNSVRFGQLTQISEKLRKLSEQSEDKSMTFKPPASSILSLVDARNVAVYGNTEYKPILAIDASPKAYLYDYGVYGKKTYLEQVWKALDWDIITRRLPPRSENYTVEGRIGRGM